ncbi:MAG: ATP-binding protein [Candidatus Eisenbacteria bacterium]|nr:ATP-binding protein [Candidatus Eisenbacteria bacterium]
MFYTRGLLDRISAGSAQFPALLLTGPRQVGKTTLLQHAADTDRRYVTLDDPTVRALAREDPSLFLRQNPPPLLIDEVQYAPGLFPYLKVEIDRLRRPGLFWLTGSQQFHMMREVTETLAGRVAVIQMLGFSWREGTRRRVDLEPFLPTRECVADRMVDRAGADTEELYRFIWTGSMPVLSAGPVLDRSLFLSSYVQTYLQRDVRDLSQVGSQESFLRFLKACAARTGQMLNLSDLARDVDISVGTARSWLSILEASLQVYLLPPFHTNVTKRLIKRPKMYFLDTGLCSYLADWTSPGTLASGAMAGAILETFVLAEILKSWWHRMRQPSLYFYRDKDGREVDFLFAQDRVLYPVEVKRSATPQRDWRRPLAALDRLSGQRGPGAVICLAAAPIALDELIMAVPVDIL